MARIQINSGTHINELEIGSNCNMARIQINNGMHINGLRNWK